MVIGGKARRHIGTFRCAECDETFTVSLRHYRDHGCFAAVGPWPRCPRGHKLIALTEVTSC